jgi:hypothetical protein
MKALIVPGMLLMLASPVVAQTVFVERHIYHPVPEEVRTYVIEEEAPSVRLTEEIVVGERLPDTVLVRDIPSSDYDFAVVNERRVILEPQTRRVISIVEY